MKKTFWLHFVKDTRKGATYGFIKCLAYGTNMAADIKNCCDNFNSDEEYLGTKEIEIDLEELKP